MNKKIIIFAVLIISAGIAFFSMRGALTPYVSFKTAMESGDYVQIIGKLNPVKLTHEKGYFSFSLYDAEGIYIDVRYKGIKPANFENADQIVALGVYNAGHGIFEADKLLVKCPSKYLKAK